MSGQWRIRICLALGPALSCGFAVNGVVEHGSNRIAASIRQIEEMTGHAACGTW